jgi:hypothetical protein
MSRAPPVFTPPAVLRLDWETLAWLASRRSKPPDLDVCPVPSSLYWFYGATDKTVTCLVLRLKLRNRCDDFKSQITKSELTVLRPKPENSRPWFWGSTKKLTLLLSMCTVQTAHDIICPPDHSAIEYPTYTWPSLVLCTSSLTRATILVAVRHIAPATCTSQDKQMWFSTRNKVIA